MRRYALVVIFALLLDGCASELNGPKDNLDFYQISKLAELAGLYKNEGDDGIANINFHHYLSEDIWGNKSNWGVTSPNLPPSIRHENIEYIEVTSTDKSLTAKAIQNGCAIYEKSYIVGQDLEIKNGQIIIRKNTSLLSRGPQDITFGPSYEEVTLGIDSSKQGKVRSTLNMAVLVYLVLPFAGTVTRDVRFERVADMSQHYKNCENHQP